MSFIDISELADDVLIIAQVLILTHVLGVFSFAQPMVDGQFNVVLRMLRAN